MSSTTPKAFTGYHMTAILVGFFGIVIAVNIFMARMAIGTFGGTVVDNSYVASQKYNSWLAAAEKEAALGWTVNATRRDDGRLKLAVSDRNGAGAGFTLSATAEHPLGRAPERQLQFITQGDSHVSRESLPGGRWLLRIEVTRGGDRYRTTAEIR